MFGVHFARKVLPHTEVCYYSIALERKLHTTNQTRAPGALEDLYCDIVCVPALVGHAFLLNGSVSGPKKTCSTHTVKVLSLMGVPSHLAC